MNGKTLIFYSLILQLSYAKFPTLVSADFARQISYQEGIVCTSKTLYLTHVNIACIPVFS